MQIKELNEQLRRLQHAGNQTTYEAPPNSIPPAAGQYNGNGLYNTTEPQRTLPPLINGAMQGVEYNQGAR